MYKHLSFAAFAALVGVSPISLPAERVVKVADGDTITVIDSDKHTSRVRLWGIDAPEKAQAFGNASREHLAALVAGKDVRLVEYGRDRYGRILAEVFVGDENVCLKQVLDGYAWHYVYYAPKALSFADAEKSARQQRIGLWKDSNPIPPWQFRRKQRPKKNQ